MRPVSRPEGLPWGRTESEAASSHPQKGAFGAGCEHAEANPSGRMPVASEARLLEKIVWRRGRFTWSEPKGDSCLCRAKPRRDVPVRVPTLRLADLVGSRTEE